MGQLGLSIYPDKMTLTEIKTYLDRAHAQGFTRIFTSLLQINGDQDAVVNAFKSAIAYGNQLGMTTTIDVNPVLFEQLDVDYDDLHFFHDLGVWGVRLDEGFTGLEEAQMTRNPYNLKIEVNMSRGGHYIDQIMDYQPNVANLIGSHNFYPERYTGLGDAYFAETSQRYRNYHLNTAAFVDAPSGSFGPWPVDDGMVTLEALRGKRLDTQVAVLKLSGLIDDVLISNAVVDDADLKRAHDVFYDAVPVFHVKPAATATALEQEIMFADTHLYRGDHSDYVIRSTMPRITYAKRLIPANNAVAIQKGYVIIDNDGYSRYKGEMQIALQPLENDGRINVVGHIDEDDMLLLPLVKPWGSFKLAPVED